MNVVGYCRLSRDEDRKNYPSIEEQQKMLSEYAKTKNWTISDYYIDDNVSGYIFSRPAFNQMLDKVWKGEINVIIAKDLSRIGRKNGRTLTLLEDLKEEKTNLILIEELGGVFNLLEDNDDVIGLTTWYNERYVKDISRKVKANMHSRQKDGRLIMGSKYGYIKDPNNKAKLLVDDDLRDCIQTIFNLYEQGMGLRKLCNTLNESYNFPTPSVYLKKYHQEKGRVYQRQVQDKWNMDMVSRILKDDIYIGTLRTHKKELDGIHGKVIILPKEKQYMFENHHEAIINKEQFERVQDIMNKKITTSAFYKKKVHDYIFGGFIVCGECDYGGTGVTRIRSKRSDYIPKKVYECTKFRKYGNARCCSHNIQEDYLLANFKQFLINVKEEYKEIISNIDIENVKQKTKSRKQSLETRLDKAKEEYKVLLNQKVKDIMTADMCNKEIIEDSYIQLEKEKLDKIKYIEDQLKKIEQESIEIKAEKIKTALDYFDEVIKTEKPDSAILNTILNKIYIYHDKSVKFDLKIDIKDLV